MRKRIFLLGIAGLFILGIFGCSKNKFSLTRSKPTDVPYYNVANDSCFVCHNDPALKKTIGTETVPLYVDREKFARSIHRANRCLDCHTDIVFYKGHSEAVKTYGGWANFSAEDTSQTRNYTTKASMSCVNCHTSQSVFLSTEHYLIKKIKSSYKELKNGLEIGKDYDEAKCGKCHLTCATCHFKGEKVQQITGEITGYWSDLLVYGLTDSILYNGLTSWAIDWTTNVESHEFASGEELEEELRRSNDLCHVCHTGFYTNYNKTGYYHPDGLDDWDSLVSQRVEKYPQYEEWRFLRGDIPVDVMSVFPSLDSIYDRLENQDHYRFKCFDCHDKIHSFEPITCNKCHSMTFRRPSLHQDVACIACHDATMKPYREPNLGGPVDTVKVAAVKDNKVISWHSHMIIKPDGLNTNFCDQKCHNPETGRRIGAPFYYSHKGDIHP